MFSDAALLLVGVSLLWGVTNPLMKKGSVGIEAVKGSNFIFQFFGEVRFLMFNWKVGVAGAWK